MSETVQRPPLASLSTSQTAPTGSEGELPAAGLLPGTDRQAAWSSLYRPCLSRLLKGKPKARVQDSGRGAFGVPSSDVQPLPVWISSARGWDVLGLCPDSPWDFLGAFLFSWWGWGVNFLLIRQGCGAQSHILIMPRGQPLPATQCLALNGNRLRQE
ncbi:hypothetical protein HJG60_011880 [Phyllostomus discolor]|uniref:Uncharacterized protein n=1 Tax=Phyllostomus discolor TaxID=89673 RepID=A0A833ZIU6_9CHIR|nr:hypothetical protein HJG60_011880 [Phyllostomus discolor]